MKEANTEVKTKESPTTANFETRINNLADLVGGFCEDPELWADRVSK